MQLIENQKNKTLEICNIDRPVPVLLYVDACLKIKDISAYTAFAKNWIQILMHGDLTVFRFVCSKTGFTYWMRFSPPQRALGKV